MKGNGPSSKQILVYNFNCLKDLGTSKDTSDMILLTILLLTILLFKECEHLFKGGGVVRTQRLRHGTYVKPV